MVKKIYIFNVINETRILIPNITVANWSRKKRSKSASTIGENFGENFEKHAKLKYDLIAVQVPSTSYSYSYLVVEHKKDNIMPWVQDLNNQMWKTTKHSFVFPCLQLLSHEVV